MCNEFYAWFRIFNKAKEKQKIIDGRLGEYKFKYALINPKDGYDNLGFLIEQEEKEGKIGFNITSFLFVLERVLEKKDFADYVGLHEYIESITPYTTSRAWHGNACKIELGEVLKCKPEFIDAYADWLIKITNSSENPEEGYFKAISNFTRIIKENRLKPTEILLKFKEQLDLGYHLKE